ncbi:FtsQ-type POTRA domain-containing protein [bacterium]|nr:FtsQ-type POTRA domain-containing protein [bacterium]
MIIDNLNKNGNIVFQKDRYFREKRLSTVPQRKYRSVLKNKLVKHDNVLKVAIIILLSVFAIYELDYICRKTLYFKINDIVIKGNNIVSSETLLKMSGINIFDNTLSTDFLEVKNRIMKNPWIKSVEINRTLDNVVEINIKERSSSYVTVAGNGKRYVISEDGVVLSGVESIAKISENQNMVISGLFPSVPVLGIVAGKDRFKKAINWLKKLGSYDFGRITEIHVGDDSNFFFRLKDGMKIFVNSVKELESKLVFLKKILYKIDLQKLYIQYIDLRVNRGLIIKPY